MPRSGIVLLMSMLFLSSSVVGCVSTYDVDFDEILQSTITSYNPDELGRSSGKSGSDVERILAFHEIGRVDPIKYVESWESVLQNALRLKNEFGG